MITLYEEEITFCLHKHSLTYVHYWLHTLKSLEKNKIEVKKCLIYNTKKYLCFYCIFDQINAALVSSEYLD